MIAHIWLIGWTSSWNKPEFYSTQKQPHIYGRLAEPARRVAHEHPIPVAAAKAGTERRSCEPRRAAGGVLATGRVWMAGDHDGTFWGCSLRPRRTPGRPVVMETSEERTPEAANEREKPPRRGGAPASNRKAAEAALLATTGGGRCCKCRPGGRHLKYRSTLGRF